MFVRSIAIGGVLLYGAFCAVHAADDFSELDKAVKQLESGNGKANTTAQESGAINTQTNVQQDNLPVLPEVNVPQVPAPVGQVVPPGKEPAVSEATVNKPKAQERPPSPPAVEPQHNNAMEVKAKGHEGVVDVEARTRKVYRYDTKHNPPEFYRNANDRRTYHLPRPLYFRDYYPIIFVAIRNDDIAALKHLHQDLAVPLNIRDEYGYTPLDVAIRYNKYKAIKYLLSQGATFSSRQDQNIKKTAIYWAIESRDTLTIELLDKSRRLSSIRAKEFVFFWENGLDKAILACIFNQMSRMEKNAALLVFICKKNIGGIAFAIRHGANINMITDRDKYLLSIAVETGDIEVIQTMLNCDELLSCASLTQAACIADALALYDIFELVYSSLLKKSLMGCCEVPCFNSVLRVRSTAFEGNNVFFRCRAYLKKSGPIKSNKRLDDDYYTCNIMENERSPREYREVGGPRLLR